MTLTEQNSEPAYEVVVNHEEQYSIWPVGRELPLGWHTVGTAGPKAVCLDYISQVWTDMRPLSLRIHMESVHDGDQKGRVGPVVNKAALLD